MRSPPITPATSIPFAAALAALTFFIGCAQHSAAPAPTAKSAITAPGQKLDRQGDEIMACGQLFHTGTRIILWTDPGGYDAYRVERRFAPFAESSWDASQAANTQLTSPNRYNLRAAGLTPAQIEQVRGGGWPLPLLQDKIDQFVLHFDVAGVSRRCFLTLQDARDLSVHFMLDIDGTIYQTLDLKERAWHATKANTRSIGIEIANVGCYGPGEKDLFNWYTTDADGRTRISLPPDLGDGGVMTPNFVGRPMRPGLIAGDVQGKAMRQYDYTPEQYAALTHLTATLCTLFPKIKCDYPRGPDGKLITRKLPDADYNTYQGILGHYHVQLDKVDPGPAMNWDMLINDARKLMAN